MPYGTRAPKELLHHLSALILRRPCVSADPTEMLPGVRGSRLLDRRPPHYRCPAVPGLNFHPGDPDGARLLRSSLGDQLLTAYCWYCWYCATAYCWWPASAPLFGSQPRCPSCVCSGLEPHCRTSRCARPQPTPSPRCCSLLHCWVLRTALTGTATAFTAVLLTAAPDDCGPPGPVVSPVAVLQQPWLRNSTTAPSCELQLRVLRTAGTAARQFVSARPRPSRHSGNGVLEEGRIVLTNVTDDHWTDSCRGAQVGSGKRRAVSRLPEQACRRSAPPGGEPRPVEGAAESVRPEALT